MSFQQTNDPKYDLKFDINHTNLHKNVKFRAEVWIMDIFHALRS